MMSEDTFDVMMEIRKVDKEIAEQKQKLQESFKKLMTLEQNISNVKQMQLKAQSVISSTEMKTNVIDSELKVIHKSYDELTDYLKGFVATTPDKSSLVATKNVDELRKRRDELKEKIAKTQTAREDVARKLNEMEMQVNIQKKKNSATLLRLQKNLEELLEEEKRLLNQSK